MKNMTWRHCLLLVSLFWSGVNQASGISIPESQDLTTGTVSIVRPPRENTARPPLQTGDIVILPGGNIQVEANQQNQDLTAGTVSTTKPPIDITTRPPLRGGDIVILPEGNIQLNATQPVINTGSILSLATVLPNEPTFLALPQTSGVTHIGDHFDIEVLALAPLANASPDELVLGFGFNTLLGGTGAAQFLGSSINPLFTDVSTQDGVNLAAAGLAFPGLSANDVGSWISLAVLHFQAVATGDLNIAITSDLHDLNQGLIFLNQGPLAINTSVGFNITAVPLPPSFLLFVSGLLVGLGGIRKRC
ncbi:hypothetical protein [Methylomonas fluvii]|uniref:PEP-CTERM protein-sorting domain-containing protein n=1 Tax=Methylomonas fluvii TaxID=1854564 RepID=A0ABR9DEF0_9GAMM|nr:hypothetical protein [Methylomonas fluvii]MBD9361471.1 hypothetical protein [Methylomonas fluvii]